MGPSTPSEEPVSANTSTVAWIRALSSSMTCGELSPSLSRLEFTNSYWRWRELWAAPDLMDTSIAWTV